MPTLEVPAEAEKCQYITGSLADSLAPASGKYPHGEQHATRMRMINAGLLPHPLNFLSQGSKTEILPLELRNSIGMASAPKKIPTLGYMLRTVRGSSGEALPSEIRPSISTRLGGK